MRPTFRRLADAQPKAKYFFGLKKFPGQFAKPMAPFAAAGLIMIYAINSFADVLMSTDEYKNDPRNPKLKNKKPAEH